jgi:hypothetical protein
LAFSYIGNTEGIALASGMDLLPNGYLSKVTISGLFISLDYGAKRQQISALMKGAS